MDLINANVKNHISCAKFPERIIGKKNYRSNDALNKVVPLYILSENTWKGKIKLQLYHNSFTKY